MKARAALTLAALTFCCFGIVVHCGARTELGDSYAVLDASLDQPQASDSLTIDVDSADGNTEALPYCALYAGPVTECDAGSSAGATVYCDLPGRSCIYNRFDNGLWGCCVDPPLPTDDSCEYGGLVPCP